MAPNRDIDKIIAAAQDKHPQLQVEQLRVCFPGADDDGLWYFTHPESAFEVQLESSRGTFPFLVETIRNNQRATVHSVTEAVRLIESWLGIGDEK
jgi:hypothetical protein